MLNPIVGGTLVTVILLTPGRNKSSVSVISGDSALGLAPDEVDNLAGEVFLAIFQKLELMMGIQSKCVQFQTMKLTDSTHYYTFSLLANRFLQKLKTFFQLSQLLVQECQMQTTLVSLDHSFIFSTHRHKLNPDILILYFLDSINPTSQKHLTDWVFLLLSEPCLLYTSPSPRDLSTSRMPSSA